MKSAQVAAIVRGASGATTDRLVRLLDFFGIASETFENSAAFREAERMNHKYALLAPLNLAEELQDFAGHSAFFYGTDAMSEEEYPMLSPRKMNAVVSKDWRELTGPMHGLEVEAVAHPGDRAAVAKPNRSPIIETERGSVFFHRTDNATLTFVSCSPEIPDLDEPITGKGYDVRQHFFSAVPLLMYLRWALRENSWQSSEAGACWIVDDPLLRTKYGFCDFRLLDTQMQEQSFTTNIAMIPWNSRRTSPEMSSLVKRSQGRLSVSVHGCDHTAREFGSDDADELGAKTRLAQQRMERHRLTTGVEHDPVMVFPQGIFSRQSLRTLQEHQFVAAVNTEALPLQPQAEPLTVADVWSVAIQKYGSFPLFTRRYPTDGLANFAFDLMLGKPCLVVEHHAFFKGDHIEVLRFVQALNSLNAELHWRGLGAVVRGSFQWRPSSDGATEIRMFANELLLKNTQPNEQEYRIEKSDAGSAGVSAVTANGQAIKWQTNGYSLTFACRIPSGGEVVLKVTYRPPETTPDRSSKPSVELKIAARRYLSEFRDNFLSQHDGLLAVAQRAKRFVSRAK